MYRKNTAGQFIVVQLLLTASGAVATGLSPAARRCIDGTFAAGGGTFTEDGVTGSYKYALAQADTNGNDISIIVTATGAIPVVVNFVTTAADPTNAATFGITDIDATISSRMATYTQPTGFLTATFPAGTIANQTNITGGTITTTTSVTNRVTANTDQINGNATAAANVSKANQVIMRGTCSGGSTTTAICSAITSPATLTDAGQMIGRTIIFDSDTTTTNLQGQASNITASSTGATPTLTFTAMTHAPAAGDTFSVV